MSRAWRAWLLPEHVSDVLPVQAAHVEAQRRTLIDFAERRGFELVIPPLLEHVESLLTGTARSKDLQTFKLVDQLSGRTLALRSDTTPQAARIDAHLLNRDGVTRLCYCGPVLHAIPGASESNREPLQFGAEIFGFAGLEADLEIIELALESLQALGMTALTLDLADARLLQVAMGHLAQDAELTASVAEALSHKDRSSLLDLTQDWGRDEREAVLALCQLYGDRSVLQSARHALPETPQRDAALEALQWLADHLQAQFPALKVSFDLGDVGGQAYYTGPRFSILDDDSRQVIARGGRYDKVGSAFGRNRPAAGFGLDVKVLAACTPARVMTGAIRAPWSADGALREAIARLRDAGETVVVDLPQARAEECGHEFDRVLVNVAGRWVLQTIS